MDQPIRFPLVAHFPKDPPRKVLPWVWEQFLEAVSYREALFRRRVEEAVRSGNKRTGYWHFLGHEIKRTEIAIGLWLGRMKETADD